MSTRLERAERQAAKGKLSPTKHREIVIAERNKEILALQEWKRRAEREMKWALTALYLATNGLKSRFDLVEGEKPLQGDTEMWNLRVVRKSIELALGGSDAASIQPSTKEKS